MMSILSYKDFYKVLRLNEIFISFLSHENPIVILETLKIIKELA